jgi:hypothetical protein
MKTFRLMVVIAAAVALSAPLCWAALRIDAQDAAIKTSGENIPDYFNRTEHGWVMHKNGELGGYVSVAQAGEYTLTLRAAGSAVAGSWAKAEKWPMIQVTVDGRPVGDATINHEQFKDLPFPVKLSTGVHCVSVSFYNDGPTPKDVATAGWKVARNFFVSRMELTPPRGVAEPRRSTEKEWTASNARLLALEDEFLKQADKDIDRVRKGAVQIRVVDAGNQPVPGAKIDVELARHDFLFGCNIMKFGRFKTPAENALYAQRLADLSHYATIGFYWKNYEPVRGQPKYDETDKVVAWCQEHGISMKGHPLLWEQPSGIPAWSPDLSPKPAYTALRKLIHETWNTKINAQAGNDGKLDFRGFYGQYNVTVKAGGQTVQARFHLDRKVKDPVWTIALDGNDGNKP